MGIHFIKKHWQGRLTLPIALWWVVVVPLLLLSLLEPWLLENLFSDSQTRIKATFFSLFLTRFILFIWQLVGLVRSSDKDYLFKKDITRTRAVQFFMVLAVAFNLVYSFDTIQAANFHHTQQQTAANYRALQQQQANRYQLHILNNQQMLFISGEIAIGITAKVTQLLDKTPSVHSVFLQSAGGQVFEGRGLAKLFKQRKLTTYAFNECSSACVTAFIGGTHRVLYAGSRIGFHQYTHETTQNMPRTLHNIDEEQQRDVALFKQYGVKPEFLTKIFQAPPEQMWYPTPQELLQANVIHHLKEKTRIKAQ